MYRGTLSIVVVMLLLSGGCGEPQEKGPEGKVIITLPDMLCRFLTMGDVDSDGQNEIIAAPLKSGLWVLDYINGRWSKKLIDDNSSSFEHATLIADFEGDGSNEIYVAADDQGELCRYKWNGSGFDKRKLIPLKDSDMTFNIMPGMMDPGTGNKAPSHMPHLVLSQAQFHSEIDEEGNEKPIPGAAKMILVYSEKKGWKSELVEDSESNVFHKAIPFIGPEGKTGLLTIGANAAMLKHWVKEKGKWQSTTLYQNEFGGKQNRLRDFEIGDVNNDGKEDIVIATHDQGVILVLQERNGSWEALEIDRKPNTFVHEIELGDVDGDGIVEIFTTPSEPNKLDGTVQPGLIMMYKYNGQGFDRSIIEEFPTRHVKEILCGDIDKDGRPELYCAVEVEMAKISSGGEVEIKQYRFDQAN